METVNGLLVLRSEGCRINRLQRQAARQVKFRLTPEYHARFISHLETLDLFQQILQERFAAGEAVDNEERPQTAFLYAV